jgi:cation diffusion facilitator family transporter
MSRSPRPVIYAALAGNLAIALVKLVAAAVSGSAAMLAEGVHSLVDCGNQGLLLYALRRARRPPDDRFPFGYGKEVYFWCFVVAIEIFTLGAGAAAVRGVVQLLHPQPLRNAWLNYSVIGISLLFEGATWKFAVAQFSKTKGKWSYLEAVRHGKDPTQFMVMFEDSAALLGLLLALAGVVAQQLTGNAVYDGIASLAIAVVLIVTAIWLGHETKGLLIGESANRQVVRDIERLGTELEGIESVEEVLTMHVGPQFILVALTLVMKKSTTRQEVIDKLEKKIRRAHPRVKRVFVRVRAPGETAD